MQPFFFLLLASQIFTFSHSQSVDSQAVSPLIDFQAASLPATTEPSQAESQAAEFEAAAKGGRKGKGKGKRVKGAKRGRKGKGRKGRKKGGNGLNAAGYLKFDPPLLQLQQFSTAEVPVEVSLSEAPKGKVSVYIEAPNMVFSECMLEFTPENWSQKRKLSVTPTPYMTASSKARDVTAKFCYASTYGPGPAPEPSPEPSPDPGPYPGPAPAPAPTPAPAPVPDNPGQGNGCQEYPIKRRKGKGCRCSAIGDPHYTSFKRQKYNFMGRGAFYLVKSDKLSVQELNRGINTASAETKVALRYYNTVYVFDGKTRTAQLASDVNEGVQIIQVPGAHWKAIMSDGSVVKVSYGPNAKRPHLGTVVMLGHEYDGKVAGLCGKIAQAAGGKGGKGRKGKGKGKGGKGARGQAFEAAAAKGGWRVPDDDNIFKLGPKAVSVASSIRPAGVVKKSYCKVPDLKAGASGGNGVSYEQGEVQMTKLARFQPLRDDEYPDETKTNAAKAPTKAWLNAARAKCTALLTIKHVNAMLDPRRFIKDCVEDCILSKSYEYIEDSKRAYLSAVQDYLRSAKAEPVYNGKSPAAQKLMSAVVQACDAAGLGSTKCPGNCSNHGKCTSIGCTCDSGFTGIDCGREIPQAPPESQSYTNDPAPPEDEEEEDLPEPQISADVSKAVDEEPEAKDDEDEDGDEEDGDEEEEEGSGQGGGHEDEDEGEEREEDESRQEE